MFVLGFKFLTGQQKLYINYLQLRKEKRKKKKKRYLASIPSEGRPRNRQIASQFDLFQPHT